MSLKTICVPLPTLDFVEPALSYAIDLGRLSGATVVAQHVTPAAHAALPVGYPMSIGPYAGEFIESIRQSNAEQAAEVRSRVSDYAKSKGLTLGESPKRENEVGLSMWERTDGLFPEDYALASRAADLIVVSRPDEETIHESVTLCESLLFQSGEPLIIVPDNFDHSEPLSVLIAWNGSKEAAHAVSSAMPLLKFVRNVTILTVDSISERLPSAEDLASRLKRHDIDVFLKHVDSNYEPEEAVIHETAQSQGANLIVMGAYSHTRLREFIIGGVTRFMTRYAEIPVYLAH